MVEYGKLLPSKFGYLEGNSAPQSKSAVSINIKDSSHLMSNFLSIHFHMFDINLEDTLLSYGRGLIIF